MNIWTTLSPEWQQFLVGAAGNALGGQTHWAIDPRLDRQPRIFVDYTMHPRLSVQPRV